MFEQFRYVTLDVTMTAQAAAQLPPYKGSTIRGAFGHAFRRAACPFRACPPCLVPKTCPYTYIFETPPRDAVGLFARNSAVPHPFVLELPVDDRTEFDSGDQMTFGLVLVGKAIDFVPYFVVALREMGRAGLGRGRARWHLDKIEDRVPGGKRLLYDGATEDERLVCSATIRRGLEGNSGADGIGGQASLRFETPTRLRFSGHLTGSPEFHVLIRNLLRRLSALASYHCDFALKVDHKDLIRKAEAVATSRADLKWVDWERYSSRQNARMALGGFLGIVTFDGDLEPFAPFLRLGEVVHVGKGTAFGLGKYTIADREVRP